MTGKIVIFDEQADKYIIGTLDGTPIMEIPKNGGSPDPPPGNGSGVIKGNFTPEFKLQSAASHPTGGILVGRYSVTEALAVVSFLFVWQPDHVAGVPGPTGTSRYYFLLPEIVRPYATNNVAEHGSVRMFDGKEEWSGVPSLYNAIDHAVIAEVDGQKWGVSTPFPLAKNTQYISLGIHWIP